MNRPKRCFNAQQNDQPLDLAPATIMDVVADIAARTGAVGGFQACCLAEFGHQCLGIGNVAPLDIKGKIHCQLPAR